MSGSIGLASTPFIDAEKTDLRRFMGYPAYGVGSFGFQGWRFYQSYGLMEYRMNNFAPAEYQVAREYLGQLYVLEAAIVSAGTNMGTDEASVWKRNRTEASDRAALFDTWRVRLCGFFGIPPGPNMISGNVKQIVV